MAMSFKTKIIASISGAAIALIAVFAVLLAFNGYEEQQQAATDKVNAELEGVQRLLNESATLMNTKSATALNVLKEVTAAVGEVSVGEQLEIAPGVSAPNLAFGGHAQALNFGLVDKVKELTGSSATLFAKNNDEFIRITTNVQKPDGTRAIGTKLDPTGAAIKQIREGREFLGVVDILGNPYFTKYTPMNDAQGKLVGVYYVGYEAALGGVEAAVTGTKILQSGFVVLVDGAGKVRFHSKGVTPELAAATIKDVPDGWQLESRDVTTWGYKVYAAYPKSELRAAAMNTALTVLGGGLLLALLLAGLVSLLVESMVIAPLGGEPAQASYAMGQIAKGNLDVEIKKAMPDSLLGNLSLMQEKLRNIVNSIQKAVERSHEQNVQFSKALADYQTAKSQGVEAMQAAEQTLMMAAGKVGKGDDAVSRAADRLRV
jgi:methyl-accepting chemotaxis protein